MYVNLAAPSSHIMILLETMAQTEESLMNESAINNKSVYTRNAIIGNGRPMVDLIDKKLIANQDVDFSITES